MGTGWSWRWKLEVDVRCGCGSVTVFLGALFFVPESPRWLVKEGRHAEAAQVLARLGEPPSRLREIERVIAEESGSLRQLLEAGMRRPQLIGVTLAILQQVTGINTVLYYGSIIFTEQAGVRSTSAALWANVLVGVTNLVLTVIALFTIDRLGRKVLLIAAAAGAFWIYASMCAGTVWFVWKFTPETKGKNLEEIEQQWKR